MQWIRLHRSVSCATTIVVAAFVLAGPLQDAAAQSPQAYVAGQVIVRYREGVSPTEQARMRSARETPRIRGLGLPRTELVRVAPRHTVVETVAELERDPAVKYAEPDYLSMQHAVPNDPDFGLQWGLHNTGQTVLGTAGTPDADIDAPEAWNQTTGDGSASIAVIDDGVAQTNQDYCRTALDCNVWLNPGEFDGIYIGAKYNNGVDDDGNGLIDDWRGWDFTDSDNDPIPSSAAEDHGTKIAGIVGAVGNNSYGVSGVAWNVRIAALRVCDGTGTCPVSRIVSAIGYATQKGIKILNLSLGHTTFSQAESDAINASPALVVVAPDNGGADGVGDDIDTTPDYPCNLPIARIICVASTDYNDALAPSSNYGLQNVDLGAPGVDIYSTRPENLFGYDSGTSFAAPMVAGAAALLLSSEPAQSPLDVKNLLMQGVDSKPDLVGRTVSGGRLNLNRSLTLLNGGYPRPKGATPLNAALVPAYAPCTAPNLVHGPPDLPGGSDPDGSCGPATQASLNSAWLTVGTPDANGEAANFAGSVRLDVVIGNPATPADDADVRVTALLRDVRCRAAGPACSGGVLADYTGQLATSMVVRITDRLPAVTMIDIPFQVPINCSATADAAIGSTCAITTTMDAVVPQSIPEAKRSIFQIGQLEVYDGGPDATFSTSDNRVFARSGVFVP